MPVPTWWEVKRVTEPALVQTVEKSAFPAQRVDAAALAQQPVELALDDGQSADKRSIAGSGHAVRFQAKEPDCVLTQVRMFGCRYGMPTPPEEDFHVWLCDKEFKPIADFPFPYASFPYGEQDEKWVTLKVPPIRVPPEFVICVCFNPAATKGIYANYDKGPGTQSFTALPGGDQAPFVEGNWLIRAQVDRLKSTQ